MNMITIDPKTGEHPEFTNNRIVEFLNQHLDQFGDKPEHIRKAIEFALDPSRGGFVVVCENDSQITGAVVINHTGMEGYIPSNILVYIAVHKNSRGKGLGKELMKFAMTKTVGGVALHVEPDNPARKLYEKLGFTNKYLEMRYQPQ